MKSLSQVAANRLTSPKKSKTGEREAVRYLQCTLKDAYRSFKDKDLISFCTFCKHIENKYKKPHMMTDLCRYCEHGRTLTKQIIKHAKDKKYCQNDLIENDDTKIDLNTTKMMNIFKSIPQTEDTIKTMSKIKELMSIQFHQKIANIQRESYNKMRKDPDTLKDTILIELDFKQKIIIGKSPRQVSTEYFNPIQKTLLGKSYFLILLLTCLTFMSSL